MELNQTSDSATRNAPKKIARFTGSRRRNSSSASASASKLMRMGIVLKSRQRGANGDGQLRSDVIHLHRLLARQGQLQEAGRVPRLAFQQQFRMEHLQDHFRARRRAAQINLGK